MYCAERVFAVGALIAAQTVEAPKHISGVNVNTLTKLRCEIVTIIFRTLGRCKG